MVDAVHGKIRLAALALSVLLYAGCASVQLAPADARIQGDWVLDRTASDNTAARIDAIVAVEVAKQRARRRPPADASPADSAGTAGTGQTPGDENDDDDFDLDAVRRGPPRTDINALRARLQQTFITPAVLHIEVNAGAVRLTPRGLPGREYRPGEQTSRIDEFGAAHLDSNWSNDGFVLTERYRIGMTRIERYAVDLQTGNLVITRSLSDPVAGKVQLRSIYHRA